MPTLLPRFLWNARVKTVYIQVYIQVYVFYAWVYAVYPLRTYASYVRSARTHVCTHLNACRHDPQQQHTYSRRFKTGRPDGRWQSSSCVW